MTPGAPPESFDVGEWLRRHPEASFKSVDPSEYFAAQRIGKGWTKRGDSIRFDEASGLACLKLPPTPLDLNSNIEAYIAKEEGISKLAGVETVILAGEAAKSAIEGFDVVTFRNNLNKILGTVYDSRAPWTVDGCVHGSTLFLDITEQPKDEITNGWQRTDLGKKLVAWGYQFEAACTGKAAGDATSEYGTLVEAKLGNNLQLIIGAEIDAYDPSLVEFSAQEGGRGVESGVPPLSSLVELKTFKLPAHKGQHRTLYRFKHARWWIQSFLAGTPGLVLGQRDDEGIVHAIHRVKVADLEHISRREGHNFAPSYALAFGETALRWMLQIARQWAGRHVRFTYCPESSTIAATVLPDGDLPSRVQHALSNNDV